MPELPDLVDNLLVRGVVAALETTGDIFAVTDFLRTRTAIRRLYFLSYILVRSFLYIVSRPTQDFFLRL